MYLLGAHGQWSHYAILQGFAPKGNYKPGDLNNKIRLLAPTKANVETVLGLHGRPSFIY